MLTGTGRSGPARGNRVGEGVGRFHILILYHGNSYRAWQAPEASNEGAEQDRFGTSR